MSLSEVQRLGHELRVDGETKSKQVPVERLKKLKSSSPKNQEKIMPWKQNKTALKWFLVFKTLISFFFFKERISKQKREICWTDSFLALVENNELFLKWNYAFMVHLNLSRDVNVALSGDPRIFLKGLWLWKKGEVRYQIFNNMDENYSLKTRHASFNLCRYIGSLIS